MVSPEFGNSTDLRLRQGWFWTWAWIE